MAGFIQRITSPSHVEGEPTNTPFEYILRRVRNALPDSTSNELRAHTWQLETLLSDSSPLPRDYRTAFLRQLIDLCSDTEKTTRRNARFTLRCLKGKPEADALITEIREGNTLPGDFYTEEVHRIEQSLSLGSPIPLIDWPLEHEQERVERLIKDRQPSLTHTTDRLDRHAQEAETTGNFLKAAEFYETLEFLVPHGDYRFRRATALLRAGMQDAASALYEEIVLDNPEVALYHSDYGAALAMGGYYDLAVEHLRRAHSIDPTRQFCIVNLASVLISLNRDLEAACLLQSSLRVTNIGLTSEQESGLASILHRCASIAWQEKESQLANELAAIATELDPEDTIGWMLRAMFALSQQDDDLAAQYLDAALRVDPQASDAIAARAEIAARREEYPYAASLYRTLITTGYAIDGRLWNDIGVCFLRTGEIETARDCFTSATESDPSDPMHWTNLAAAKMLLDPAESDQSGVFSLYETALSIDPNYLHALLYYSQCLISWNRIEEAIPLLDRALRIDPENSIARGLVERLEDVLGR